jgi:hypothetical protein
VGVENLGVCGETLRHLGTGSSHLSYRGKIELPLLLSSFDQGGKSILILTLARVYGRSLHFR